MNEAHAKKMWGDEDSNAKVREQIKLWIVGKINSNQKNVRKRRRIVVQSKPSLSTKDGREL